jgi:hypothetical protein
VIDTAVECRCEMLVELKILVVCLVQWKDMHMAVQWLYSGCTPCTQAECRGSRVLQYCYSSGYLQDVLHTRKQQKHVMHVSSKCDGMRALITTTGS